MVWVLVLNVTRISKFFKYLHKTSIDRPEIRKIATTTTSLLKAEVIKFQVNSKAYSVRKDALFRQTEEII